MEVIATKPGWDGVKLRQAGDTFDMPEGAKGTWFKSTAPDPAPAATKEPAPAPAPKATPAPAPHVVPPDPPAPDSAPKPPAAGGGKK